MKSIFLKLTLWIGAILLMTNCTEVETSTTSKQTNATSGQIADNSKDSTAVVDLVRKMYQWYEKLPAQGEFEGKTNKASDTIYSSLDIDLHQKRLQALEASDCFASEFIDNYKKIGQNIDQALKSGKTIWLVGDMSPFGDGADPWCACQDRPDAFSNLLIIKNMQINENKASCTWTLDEQNPYQVRAVKENGQWKIAYLQGFDFEQYLHQSAP
jgi:hypothetical protein